MWLRENGAVSILSFLAFFHLFQSHLWPNLRPILVMRPVVVSLRFPCFTGISAGFGVSEPQNHYLSFSGPNVAFSDFQNTMFQQQKLPNIKLGNNAKRTTGSIFTHVQRGLVLREVAFMTVLAALAHLALLLLVLQNTRQRSNGFEGFGGFSGFGYDGYPP